MSMYGQRKVYFASCSRCKRDPLYWYLDVLNTYLLSQPSTTFFTETSIGPSVYCLALSLFLYWGRDLVNFFTHLPLAVHALDHFLLGKVSIRLPAERTGQTLVALLVTTIAHRVVEMPPRAGTTTRRVRTTVSTHSTILETESNAKNNQYIICTSKRLSINIIS